MTADTGSIEPETDLSRWLSSGVPRTILVTLAQPATLTALADALEIVDARVLIYLQQLERHGLVERVGDDWRTTSAGAAVLQLPEVSPTDVTVLPVPSVVDYQQSFADADAGVYGDDVVLAAGEHGARLERARVAEFNERLQTLVAEYFSPTGADPAASPKYGFRWVLTPVDLHPLGDR